MRKQTDTSFKSNLALWYAFTLLIFKLIGRSIFKLEPKTKLFPMSTCPKQANGLTSISKAKAQVVSYHPVKFQVHHTKHLRVRVRKPKFFSDECMPKIGTQTESNFKTNQALVMSYHPVKFQTRGECP